MLKVGFVTGGSEERVIGSEDGEPGILEAIEETRAQLDFAVLSGAPSALELIAELHRLHGLLGLRLSREFIQSAEEGVAHDSRRRSR